MASIIVVGASGEEKTLEARPGQTVMEVIRDAGFDEMLALCGGCCSCATCHVHLEEGQVVAALGTMSEDENDLLDSSNHRNDQSRLSCQLQITDALDGLRVRIAPED